MKRKEVKNIIIGVTHGGNPHIDDLLSISILSYFSIINYNIPLLVIRSSNIEEILKIIDKIKKNYEINDIYILDQTINIDKLKNFKNIEIKVIDHHDKNTNNCTFQLLLEYLYPEYSLKLLDFDFNFDFNFDFSNFNNFDNKKIFKPINFIDKYLKLISISDTNGPITSFQYFYGKNIENINELLEFEYFILKNPFIFAILKYFNKKYFFIKSDKNIFYILGNIIIKQLFNNFKIKDLEFETINSNIIIVKSKKRYLDTHILKFTLEYFNNLDLNDDIIIIYFKNSNRNSEEYSIHLINIFNKKFNITKLEKLIDLKFIHGNHKIIAIDKKDYQKFIDIIKKYNDEIIL